MTVPGSTEGFGQSSLVTGDAVVLDLRPAGFATRMTAFLIDAVVQVSAMILAFVLVARVGAGVDAAATAAISLTLTVLTVVGYPTAFETLSRGRSLGKMALGLRVVGVDGSAVRFRQALARALASVIEIWGFTIVALVTSLLNRDGRRIGDFLAATMVVQERAGTRRDEAITMPPRLAGWAQSAELSRLSPETAATARQYLLRFEELADDARHDMGMRIADLVARSVSPPPPPGVSPPEYLSAVLAERRRREEAKMARRAPVPGAQDDRPFG
ncbi:RDD family protein [Nocardiopsis mangrovi]|uniref:RDD family protein n=1 Tax=Nocardiopsis mangrovi TaxID=1179818 RepID=A0ABV9DT11_9ACTN